LASSTAISEMYAELAIGCAESSTRIYDVAAEIESQPAMPNPEAGKQPRAVGLPGD